MKKSLKIGRASNNDIIIDDPRVSRYHTLITNIGNGKFEVKDLNSTNGTFVNGKRVMEQIIYPGDIVHTAECMVDWERTFYQISGKTTSILAEEHSVFAITEKKDLLEKKNKDITDSIRYAKQLQEAAFPKMNQLNTYFTDSHILYIPKDIVSGDFYWFTFSGNKIILAVVDCTGHGVPGAFMSILGMRLLDEIIIDKGIRQPSVILHYLDMGVKSVLQQQHPDSEIRDGMDAALCVVDFSANQLHFAGAYRPLFYFQNGSLKVLAGDKLSIGGVGMQLQNKKFNDYTIPVKKGDLIYLFTDGYSDQFGGNNGRKFMTVNFRKLLTEISHMDLQKQKNVLQQTHENWKGHLEQTDDILITGLRF